MEKEVYWSRFADDFEEKSNYVVGKADVEIILKRLAEQKGFDKKRLVVLCRDHKLEYSNYIRNVLRSSGPGFAKKVKASDSSIPIDCSTPFLFVGSYLK